MYVQQNSNTATYLSNSIYVDSIKCEDQPVWLFDIDGILDVEAVLKAQRSHSPDVGDRVHSNLYSHKINMSMQVHTPSNAHIIFSL